MDVFTPKELDNEVKVKKTDTSPDQDTGKSHDLTVWEIDEFGSRVEKRVHLSGVVIFQLDDHEFLVTSEVDQRGTQKR